MYNENEFNLDLEIDPDNLDVELLRQPMLFSKYARMEAGAKKAMAEAHEDLKITRSQLIKEVASNKDYGNAQKVEAYYRDHPDHIAAKEKLIQAEYEANILSNTVFSLHQRKTVLENLVRLALAEWFARPGMGRELAEELKNYNERRQTQINDKAKDRMQDVGRTRMRK